MIRRRTTSVRVAVVSLAVVGAVLLPLPQILPSFISTGLFLVTEDRTFDEDVYVAAQVARVEGTIEGDLIVAAGEVSISGQIDGDVLVLSQGRLTVSGVVAGSVRGAAWEVVITGSVEDDVTVVAASSRVDGAVGRDVLAVAGSALMAGTVGRDLTGRMVSLDVAGEVGRDVDVAVQAMEIGPTAVVGGDILYRSTDDASISAGARIAGETVRLPARGTFLVALLFQLATILSILAFVLAGLFVFWLFRGTAPKAAGVILTMPWRVLGVGLLTVFLLPIAAALLIVTVVGLPVGLVLLVALMLALVFGPIPALAAFGDRLTRGRGGVYGAFLVGALVWRLLAWVLPIFGVALYLAALVWGVGGWFVAGWRRRAASIASLVALEPADDSGDDVTGPREAESGWEPPLPPVPPAATNDHEDRVAEGGTPESEPPPSETPDESSSSDGAG